MGNDVRQQIDGLSESGIATYSEPGSSHGGVGVEMSPNDLIHGNVMGSGRVVPEDGNAR